MSRDQNHSNVIITPLLLFKDFVENFFVTFGGRALLLLFGGAVGLGGGGPVKVEA